MSLVSSMVKIGSLPGLVLLVCIPGSLLDMVGRILHGNRTFVGMVEYGAQMGWMVTINNLLVYYWVVTVNVESQQALQWVSCNLAGIAVVPSIPFRRE